MISGPKKRSGPSRAYIRVLLIDDDSGNIETIRSMLSGSEENYRVSCTCSPSVIQRKVERKLADVVLLSLTCQNGNVKNITDAIGKIETVPVIVLSGTESKADFPGINLHQTLSWSGIDSTLLYSAISTAIEKQKTSVRLQENMSFQYREARYLNVILSSEDGIVIVNSQRQILFINPAARQMLNISETQKNRTFPYCVETGITAEIRPKRKGSKPERILEMRAVETLWDNEQSTLLSLRDITSRKTAEDALRVSEERYALAIKGSKDGVWDWDLVTGNIYFCDQWKAMLGYSLYEIGSSTDEWFSRINSSDQKRVKKNLNDHLEGKTPFFECEYRVKHKDGSCKWVQARGTALRDNTGKAIRIAGSQTEITERKTAERQLKGALDDLRFALASEKVLMQELDRRNKELVELSITDGLTGLYNHRFLQERFEFEFKRVRRYGGELSCMIIDIDHFKMVNDTYGHQFGDSVLRQISRIMKTKSREVDICGRYGGEEFMIIANLKADDALIFATKLHSAIESYVFQQDSISIHVTVSIGVADHRNDIKTRQELIERADSALYQAKRDGRNLIRVWKEFEGQEEKTMDRYGVQELKGKFHELSRQMRLTYMESINALIKTVDAKDPYAKEHSQNVSDYAVEIAKYFNFSESEIEVIRYAGLLHDIGKISIRDETLVKKDQLTNKEFDVLRRHPEIGVNILKELKFLEKEIPAILYHHERYDGSGYPHGLKGREIPVGARIIAVADSFDAMISGRTYKKKLSLKLAIEELKKGSGTQFAPEIVDAFVKLTENGHIGPKVNMEQR